MPHFFFHFITATKDTAGLLIKLFHHISTTAYCGGIFSVKTSASHLDSDADGREEKKYAELRVLRAAEKKILFSSDFPTHWAEQNVFC